MDAPRGAVGSAPVREPPFELTFRLEARDYQAFLRKLRWRAIERAVAELPAVALGIIGALIGLSAFRGEGSDAGWGFAAALGGGLILYLGYRLVVMPSYHASLFAGQPMALGDIKVVADMRGIGTNVAEIVTAMPWPRVARIVETDQHVFLMFARLAGVIVPKRAFASTDQAKRFVAFARSMMPTTRR
jgi:hypothetical protein